MILGIVLLSVVMLPAFAHAACSGSSPNWTVASPYAASDVNDCVTAASNGDTINIPAGTHGWSSTVTISKAVHLKGAGIGSTTIQDNGTTNTLLQINLVANLTTRVSDIYFQNGTRANGSNFVIVVDNNSNTVDSRRFVLENNVYDRLVGGFPIVINRAYGLIANSTFYAHSSYIQIYPFHLNSEWADDRWTESIQHGTDLFVFIEDCVFERDGATGKAFLDAYAGARYVVRNNSFKGGWLEAHGTESGGRPRGTRGGEIYDNTFDFLGYSTGNTFLGARSGSWVVYNNSATNWAALAAAIDVTNHRAWFPYAPFGQLDGFNALDENDPGNPLDTGTATSVATRTVTVTGKSWTTDEWKGHYLRKMTAPCNVPISAVNTGSNAFTVTGHGLSTGNQVLVMSHLGSTPNVQGLYTVTVVDSNNVTLNGIDVTTAGSGGYMSLYSNGTTQPVCSAVISANTSDTVTYVASDQGCCTMVMTGGDTYQINGVVTAFDQVGKCCGTDLAGVNPMVVPTVNDQIVEPSYEWNNTKSGADIDISVRTEFQATVLENTHYFNDTTKPGYTAYTYPHPLASGGSPPADPGGRRFSPMHNLRRASFPLWPVPYVNTTMRGLYAILARR